MGDRLRRWEVRLLSRRGNCPPAPKKKQDISVNETKENNIERITAEKNTDGEKKKKTKKKKVSKQNTYIPGI